ncbi:choline/ethanolaminephosphotransferase [Vairimorpha necatrix]|uniref:Choline/ethanolaminephosphotransferase n=1 Tax=Vairimorpha necatrix TaxID=6039 RepID=A0AAX4J8D8_9MICR
MFSLFTDKLTLKEKHKLKTHQYKSVDKSILSACFFKRYTSTILNYTPECISPNMLTLFGYSIMLANFLFVIYFDLELKNKEDWLALLSATSLIFYFTMDNLDGAQARKLKEMSPMGQLFDHGVDSCAVFFCMISMISSLKLGLTQTSLMMMLAVMFGFYFAGLEEKFAGFFEFGQISGPTEGILFMVVLHLMSAYCNNTLKYTVDRITFYPELTRLITFISISPLFIISLSVFLFNYIVSFIKSLKCAKWKNWKEVMLSYFSIGFLIIPLYQIHYVFPLRPDLKIINFMIFAQIFSLKYIEEVYFNIIGRTPSYVNITYILYYLASIVVTKTKFEIDNYVLVSLLLFSTIYYLNSVSNLIMACKTALRINVFCLNQKKIK